MFVTQLIKEKKNIFKKYINYPEFKYENLKVYEDPVNYSIIGHAYEILFQLKYFKRNNYSLRNIKGLEKKELILSFKKSKLRDKILKKLYKIEKRINNNTYSMKDVLNLAYISNIRLEKDIIKKQHIDDMDILDLKKLNKSIKYKKLMKKDLIFNSFVSDDNIIGEIDIKSRKMIIDIKTVVDGTIKQDFINQLILYYLLSENRDIKKIGILFSRFKKLKVFKIRDILSKKKEKKLRRALQIGE